MGRPKALVDDWLVRSVGALRQGGCNAVTVVLGAAEEARALLDAETAVVLSANWAQGMGASLRAGLAELPEDADAALVSLVDLPDVGADVVRRVLTAPVAINTLRRASYGGEPGHPVLLGRTHWGAIARTAAGDRGARDYLARHPVEQVECGDLATGADSDVPSPEP